jgi:SAM-dependent methyltransferase
MGKRAEMNQTAGVPGHARRLNFGCGLRIMADPEWVNADIQRAPGIQDSFDFNQFPYPYGNEQFDYILVDNVLEHLVDPRAVLRELWRIGRKDAIIRIRVPYWNAKCAYNDCDHKHFFNERAMELLVGANHSYAVEKDIRFAIQQMRFIPSRACCWIPGVLRRVLAVYLCNIIRALEVELRILK